MALSLNLGNLTVHLLGNASQFTKTMKQAESRMMGASARMASAGLKMSLAFTAPIAAIGIAATKAFANFDDAMTKSLSIITDVTPELRKEMESTARTMSKQSVTSATDLAKSYYFLASAGLSAEQSINALAVVERFAVAGAFDMALATDLLTDAQTAMGLSSKDAMENMKQLTRISDVLGMASVQSNASIQQFSESLTNNAATAAKSTGQELETTVAILDAFAAKGKKGAEAGSLVGRAFRLATSNYRKQTDVWKKMGIEVIGSSGEYRNFIDIISDMERSFAGLTEPQRDARLEMLGFEALALKSITPLIGMSDAMRKWESELKGAGGTIKRMADDQLKSFSNQMTILWNNITDAAIAIGEMLAPMILKLNGYIQKAIDYWNSLDKGLQRSILGWSIFVAAIGPVLLVLSKVVAVVAGFIGLLASLPVLLVALTAVFALLVKDTWLGKAAVDAIAHAFDYWKRVLKGFFDDFTDSYNYIIDAIKDGELSLAFDIMWAQVEVAWHKGLGKLSKMLDDFIKEHKTVFDILDPLGAQRKLVQMTLTGASEPGQTTAADRQKDAENRLTLLKMTATERKLNKQIDSAIGAFFDGKYGGVGGADVIANANAIAAPDLSTGKLAKSTVGTGITSQAGSFFASQLQGIGGGVAQEDLKIQTEQLSELKAINKGNQSINSLLQQNADTSGAVVQ